jgi:tetratricopeptide (TPR) repeat protein
MYKFIFYKYTKSTYMNDWSDYSDENQEYDWDELLARYDQGESGALDFDEVELETVIRALEEDLRYDEALSLVEDSIRLYPFSVVFLILQARIYCSQRHFEESLECLEKAELLDNSELELYLVRADIFTVNGRYVEAIQLLSNLLQTDIDPEDTMTIYIGLSAVFERVEQYKKMFESLEAAVLCTEDNQLALERLVAVAESYSKYDKAIAILNKVIQQYPYHHQAWSHLGFVHCLQSNFEDAIEALDMACELDETQPLPYSELATCYHLSGNYTKAIEVYKMFIKRFEPYPEVYVGIGQCYTMLKEFDKATKYIQLALKIDSNCDLAFYSLGELFSEQTLWLQAKASYEKAIAFNRAPEYLRGLAMATYKLGSADDAFDLYCDAISEAPEDLDSWVDFFDFLIIECKDLETASSYIQMQLSAGSKVATFYFIGSAIAYLQGNKIECYRLFEEGLSLDFNDYEIMVEYIDDFESDVLFQHILKSHPNNSNK